MPIEAGRLSSIEDKIEAFVRGPLNISKERMTLSREEGGLGLFSQKLFWVGRYVHGQSEPRILTIIGN